MPTIYIVSSNEGVMTMKQSEEERGIFEIWKSMEDDKKYYPHCGHVLYFELEQEGSLLVSTPSINDQVVSGWVKTWQLKYKKGLPI